MRITYELNTLTNFLWRVRFVIHSSIFSRKNVSLLSVSVSYHVVLLLSMDYNIIKQTRAWNFLELSYRKRTNHMHTPQNQTTKEKSILTEAVRLRYIENEKRKQTFNRMQRVPYLCVYKFVDLFNYVDIFNHWIIFLRCISISRHIIPSPDRDFLYIHIYCTSFTINHCLKKK